MVERLGYVQIDTISVIERAHHHVMATRQPAYRPWAHFMSCSMDRAVFEYWSHAASYVPMRDYRYYLPRMKGYREPARARQFRAAHPRLMKKVLDRIRNEGALSASDFEHKSSDSLVPWWDWKPAKQALEFLFGKTAARSDGSARATTSGASMICPSEVIPEGIDTREADEAEAARHFAKRALAVHGAATVRSEEDVLESRGGAGAAGVGGCGGSGEDSGGRGRRGFLRRSRNASTSCRRRLVECRVDLLSPFDNLVIDRERLIRLFDFDYKIECYTPAPKRRYGYFTLPILWKGRLVGRLDPKAERKEKRFVVRNVVLEPWFREEKKLAGPLAKALRQFAGFNRCEEVVVEKASPGGFLKMLREAV